MKRVGIIDYGAGNIAGLAHALRDAGAAVSVNSTTSLCIPDPDAVVLPGVGNFAYCAERLARHGEAEAVKEWAASGKPLLGVCVGMQLLFEESEEGPAKGLGILPGRVARLKAPRLPHVGWNEVGGQHYYFSHSYGVDYDSLCDDRINPRRVSLSQYPADTFIVASVEYKNVAGVQFHPEKSGAAGVAWLRRWVEGL